jgi:hypothetical protein
MLYLDVIAAVVTGLLLIVCACVVVVCARVNVANKIATFHLDNRNGVDAANVEVVSAAPDRDGCKRCAFMFLFVMIDILAKIMIDCAADNFGAGQSAWIQSELQA